MTESELNGLVKKRSRLTIVCVSCKRKKIKCDRQEPCGQCTKANINCQYPVNRGHSKTEVSTGNLPYMSSAKNPMMFDGDEKPRKKRVTNQTTNQNANHNTSNESKDALNTSLSELAMLKARISQIEVSLGGSDSSTNSSISSESMKPPKGQTKSSANSQLSRSSSESGSISSATNQSINSAYSNPIQLPPINFNPNGLSSNNYSIYNKRPEYKTSPSTSSFGKPDYRTSPSTSSSLANGSVNSISPSIKSETSPASSTPNSYSDSNSMLGVLPYIDDHDYINFYEGYTSIHVQGNRTVNFGPFAWASIMKKDKGLSILWDSFDKNCAKNAAAVFNNNNTANVSKSEKNFQSKVLLHEKDQDLVPYTMKKSYSNRKPSDTNKLNESTLSLGLTYYDGQLNRELQLIEKIKVILPKKKVLWKLIRRFFSWVYPYTPFIDEMSFISETTKLVGPESCEDEFISTLNVEKRIDLAHLGLLLIVIRLAYLSLFTNKASVNERNLNSTDPSPRAQEIKYLLLNPINIDVFEVAQDCLDQFQLLRRMSFQVLQLTFFIRLYNVYSPEEGDIADCEPQTLNGVLIQMAYSLGLNREPDNFPDVLNDPKQNNLRRKMWYFLVMWDMFYACTVGNPMLTDTIYHDVKIPFYEPGNSNVSDIALDKAVTESFGKCAMFSPKLRNILTKMLLVNGKPKMSELSPLLSQFELAISVEYSNLEECLKPLKEPGITCLFDRNLTVKSYLFLKTFFMTIYFYFYLHYEEKNLELSYFYLKKLLLISCDDIMPHYFNLLGDNEILCDMIINPTLENLIHKGNQMNFAFIIKVNFKIHQLKSQPDHIHKCETNTAYNDYFVALCQLSSYITRCAEISIAAVSKLSNRYYQAWKITKGHTFILKTITTVDFYNTFSDKAQGLIPALFSIEQIEEVNHILKTGLSKVESRDYNFSTTDAQPKNQGDFYKMYANLCSTMDCQQACDKSMCNLAMDLGDTINIPQNQNQNQVSQSNQSNAPELDFLQSEDIDKLWLQMLSMKYDKQENNFVIPRQNEKGPIVSNDGEFTNGYNPWRVDSNFSATPITPSSFDTRGISFEQSDVFSDFPFDQIFKQ